ncbi:MAG: hypothetical protein JJU02_13680 [Cryomorphaceae bacterium]|nr:hypothetical protein [Cryomorphaceae bacterium]
MRRLLILLFCGFLTSCILEESETSTYSMKYDCGINEVTLFNFDGKRKIIAGKHEINNILVSDSVVQLQAFFMEGNKQYRLDLLFYTNDTTAICQGKRGDGSLLEVFRTENGGFRTRFYSSDCSENTFFLLHNYDVKTQTACGSFSFSGLNNIYNVSISNGFFDL